MKLKFRPRPAPPAPFSPRPQVATTPRREARAPAYPAAERSTQRLRPLTGKLTAFIEFYVHTCLQSINSFVHTSLQSFDTVMIAGRHST